MDGEPQTFQDNAAGPLPPQAYQAPVAEATLQVSSWLEHLGDISDRVLHRFWPSLFNL